MVDPVAQVVTWLAFFVAGLVIGEMRTRRERRALRAATLEMLRRLRALPMQPGEPVQHRAEHGGH